MLDWSMTVTYTVRAPAAAASLSAVNSKQPAENGQHLC